MIADVFGADGALPVSYGAPNCMVWPLAVATRTGLSSGPRAFGTPGRISHHEHLCVESTFVARSEG